METSDACCCTSPVTEKVMPSENIKKRPEGRFSVQIKI